MRLFSCCFKKSCGDNNVNNSIPFIPPIAGGYVTKVYDGDTITILSRLPYATSPLYRFSIRFAGIDAPEIRSVSQKENALKSKHALEELILHKIITLRNIKTEKYGRVLADVYIDELHVNQWLLDHHFAVPYFGGKKIISL